MYFTLKFSEYVPVSLVMKAIVIKLKTKVIYWKQKLQKKPKKLRQKDREANSVAQRIGINSEWGGSNTCLPSVHHIYYLCVAEDYSHLNTCNLYSWKKHTF